MLRYRESIILTSAFLYINKLYICKQILYLFEINKVVDLILDKVCTHYIKAVFL